MQYALALRAGADHREAAWPRAVPVTSPATGAPVPFGVRSRDRPERTPARALARPARRSRPGRVPGRSGRRSRRRDRGHHPRQPPGEPRGVLRVHPRRASTDGHDHARRRGRRAARSRCSSSAPLAARRRPGAGAERARRALGPVAAAPATATRRASMRVLGVTGTNGKTTTTYLLEAIARAAGERAGRDRHRRARFVGDDALDVETSTPRPRPTELQALLARMRDARRRHRRDGGVVARARPASRRRHAVRRGVLHQPQPRAPRLPRLARRVLRGEGSRCSTRRASPAAAIERRRPARRASSRDACARPGLDVWTYARRRRRAPTSARPTSRSRRHGTAFTLVDRRGGDRRRVAAPARRRVQRRQRARGRRHRPRRRLRPRRGRPPGSRGPLVVPGRFERVDAGQPFTVLVDYAHTPDALAAVLAAARPLAGAGGRVIVRLRLRWRPRPGASGRSWARRSAAGADLAVAHLRQPPLGGPAGDRRRGAPRPRRRPRRGRGRARPPRRHRRRARAPPRAGDVVVIAGKGHETGQTDRRAARARSTTASSRARSWRRSDGADRAPRSPTITGGLADRGDARRACVVVRHRLARRSRPARASSRSSPSATATTSSPTRSRAARRVALVTATVPRRARRRRGRAGRRRVRRARRPRALPRATRSATSLVVGITGSAGKTGTKDLTAAALAPTFRVHASPGSFNNEIGRPAHAARRAARRPRRWCSRWARAPPATSPRSARSRARRSA